MRKVPPALLLTASCCSHRQRVQAAEERSRRTELVAHGKGRNQRERSSGRRVSKAFSECRHSIPAHHNNEGYLVKNKSDAILTNSWYINLGPPKLRKDTWVGGSCQRSWRSSDADKRRQWQWIYTKIFATVEVWPQSLKQGLQLPSHPY